MCKVVTRVKVVRDAFCSSIVVGVGSDGVQSSGGWSQRARCSYGLPAAPVEREAPHRSFALERALLEDRGSQTHYRDVTSTRWRMQVAYQRRDADYR